MAKQKGGREVSNADEVVNVKQGDVAALLKKKLLAEEAAAQAAAKAEPEMVAAADSVFATDAQYMVAQAGGAAAGGASGLSTGALLGIGAAAIVGGVLIGDAISSDDSPAAAAAPGGTGTGGGGGGAGGTGNTGGGDTENLPANPNTFSLRNNTENVDNVQGTTGNDTFIGDNSSISSGDTINGGDGTDLLKAFNTNTLLNSTNVENYYYNRPNSTPAAAVGTNGALDVSNVPNLALLEVDTLANPAATIPTAAGAAFNTLRNGQALTLTNISANQAPDTGAATYNIAGNTVTALTLTVNTDGNNNNFGFVGNGAAAPVAAGNPGDQLVDLQSTALTTLNLVAGGTTFGTSTVGDSSINLVNTGLNLATINISGNKNLDLQFNTKAGTTIGTAAGEGFGATTAGAQVAMTTIDASKATGSIDIDQGIVAGALKFTGGSGNDRIVMANTLGGSDVLNGGAGTDQLAVTGTASTFKAAAGVIASDQLVTALDVSAAATVQGTSNFETIQIDSAIASQAVDLGAFNAKNTITGLVLSQEAQGAAAANGGAFTQIVTNINAATAGNINFTADQITALTLGVNSFISGGITDTATLIFDNSRGAFANGVGSNFNGVDVATVGNFLFNNVDVLNINSKSDGSKVVGEQNSIGTFGAAGVTALAAVGAGSGIGLLTPDVETITITGDNNFSLTTATAATSNLTVIDASGLSVSAGTQSSNAFAAIPVNAAAGTAAAAIAATNGTFLASPALAGLALDTSKTGLTSVLVKGTTGNDVIDISNALTLQTTLQTGGGSDVINLALGATGVHTFQFSATTLNSGDIKAGDSIDIGVGAGSKMAIGSQVNIDFSGALENLLKYNGTNLGTTNANVAFSVAPNATDNGALVNPLSAQTNIAAFQQVANGTVPNNAAYRLANTMVIQIDLNGDGQFIQADDWQMTVRGVNATLDTLVYNQASDVLTFTVT